MEKKQRFRYFQLADELRKQILSGQIEPGQFLMSEHELCQHYQMSRITVRKSLERLAMEGLIVKKAGQGSMVSYDLSVKEQKRNILRIVSVSPSYFVDDCLPIILKHFQEEHPDTEVKVISLPHPDFWNVMDSDNEMRIQPDLMIMADSRFDSIREDVEFADLRPFLNADYEALAPGLKEPFRTNDRVMAVPVGFSPVVFAYNPHLFHKYGVKEPEAQWERDDFVRSAQKLTIDTNGDGIVDLYGFSVHKSLSRWAVIALQSGVDFHNMKQGSALEDALTFIHDLLYRYRIAYLHGSNSFTMESHPFLHQNTAMILTSTIELAMLKQLKLPFEPKIADLPFGHKKSTVFHTSLFAVPSGCKQKELAVQLLLTAIQPKVQREICEGTGLMSAIPAVNESIFEREHLEKLNISRDRMNDNYMIRDLFPHTDPHSFETELQLYWSGMRTAREGVERIGELVAGASPERIELKNETPNHTS